jgi:hypothetical protein
MEYLLVKFQESRGVIVDGDSEGMTNQVLELETGTHSVTLEPPIDFTPDLHEFLLRKTSVISPRVISFEKI